MHPPCSECTYAVLVRISPGYPPVPGMSLTRYAPLRRSPPESIAAPRAAPRLACVRPAASVHPEPGSNSSLYTLSYCFGTFACTIVFQYFQRTLKTLDPLPVQPRQNLSVCHGYFRNGLQRYGLFSSLQIFSQLFSNIFLNFAVGPSGTGG